MEAAVFQQLPCATRQNDFLSMETGSNNVYGQTIKLCVYTESVQIMQFINFKFRLKILDLHLIIREILPW